MFLFRGEPNITLNIEPRAIYYANSFSSWISNCNIAGVFHGGRVDAGDSVTGFCLASAPEEHPSLEQSVLS